VLDMDSSESPTYGQKKGSAYTRDRAVAPALRQRRAVGGRGGRGGGRRLGIPALQQRARELQWLLGRRPWRTRSCARRWMRVLDRDNTASDVWADTAIARQRSSSFSTANRVPAHCCPHPRGTEHAKSAGPFSSLRVWLPKLARHYAADIGF
jgi:hypothetical protein